MARNEYSRYRRCGAMIASSTTGRRCKRESVTGDDELPRCERHFEDTRKKSMSRYYRETLRPALGERVQQILEETPGVALTSVHEELVVAREAAAQIVGLFGMAYQNDAERGDGKIGEATGATALATVDMMQQVTKIAESAARIDSVRQQVAGSMAHAVELIISRVARAAYDAFGEDYRVAEFVESLRTEVLSPLHGTGQHQGLTAIAGEIGTALLPSGAALDDVVTEMDDTVPLEETEEETEEETGEGQ